MQIIDLSLLPPPSIVEELSFETVLADMRADLIERYPELEPTLQLESAVVVKLMEACAYREVLVRARVNDAARALLLARAEKADLDHLAADFNLERKVLVPASDGADAVLEGDAEFRARRQLAPEGYAAAGPTDAYRFHALSADASIKQVAAIKGDDNRVTVVLLSRDGNGAVDADVVAKVHEALSPLSVRPLTDALYTRSAEIIETSIAVRIEIGAGPDAAVIEAKAMAGLAEYASARHAIGTVLRIDGIIGAARKADPIERVVVTAPNNDVDPGPFGAAYVTSITAEVVHV